MRDTRPWLQQEVDVMVAEYKRGDWTGVHQTIARMLLLDGSEMVTITRQEARLIFEWYRVFRDHVSDLTVADSDLAELLNERSA